MNDEEKNALNEVLLANRAVQLQVVDQFCENFIPPPVPTRLNSILNPDFASGKTFEEILIECDRMLNYLVVTPEQASFFADSGATKHMCDQKSFFITFKSVELGSQCVSGKKNGAFNSTGII